VKKLSASSGWFDRYKKELVGIKPLGSKPL
jgi:hypothetical protein